MRFALPLDLKSDPRLDLRPDRKKAGRSERGSQPKASTAGLEVSVRPWYRGWSGLQVRSFTQMRFPKSSTPPPLPAQYVAQRLVQNIDKKLLVVTPLRAQHLHHLHKSNIIHKIELSVWLSNDDLA